MAKAMKGICIIKRLSKMLPRHSLLTICKSIIRPHLDYGDIRYDQPNNKSLCQKIETVQYKFMCCNFVYILLISIFYAFCLFL